MTGWCSQSPGRHRRDPRAGGLVHSLHAWHAGSWPTRSSATRSVTGTAPMTSPRAWRFRRGHGTDRGA